MAYTYINKTDQELTVIGVGIVEAGGKITTDIEVNNPNLELIEEGADKQPVKKEGRK